MLDVAIQRFVLAGCGLDVSCVTHMHLTRSGDDIFAHTDLTADALALAGEVRAEARAQRRSLAGPLPVVDTGDHCTSPRDCPFHDRCHAPLPAHHVSELYAIGRRPLPVDLIADLDADVRLSAVARRQVESVKRGALIVEPGLARALRSLKGPLAFFDLETVAFALPRFPGTLPWDPVPVQASVHLEASGSLVHHAFLADPAHADPRAALARFLVHTLADAQTIVAYNMSFERRCLEQLARAVPSLARELESIIDRLADLLPIVRNHVYHPEFHGSFSLKAVAPALVPSLSYAHLDVAAGMDASAALFALFTQPSDDASALRDELLAYCAQDTIALAEVLRVLRTAARSAAPRRETLRA